MFKDGDYQKMFFKYLFSLLNYDLNAWEKYSLEILNFQENFMNLEKMYQKLLENGTLIARPCRAVMMMMMMMMMMMNCFCGMVDR